MALSLNPLKWFSGVATKASTMVQNSIRSVMTVKWSYAARRASTAYSELFHTSPRLDAVDIIATDCANAEFKIYRKTDRRKGKSEMEPVYDHPAYELLENPVPGRPDFDGFILRYLTEVYCEIHGECFWVLVRDAQGIPSECYVIPTTWMITTPSVSQPKYLMMPLGNTSSASILLDPGDVIWHKNPDAVQPYARGRGRTEAIGDQLETSEYADKWQKNFFFNDATPRTVMTMPGASKENIEEFKAAWNQQFRSVSNSSKTGFVGWEAKILTLGTSPKEMDFTESLKAIADVCRQHYQIPPEIFGILDNSNRSTIDAARYLYAVNVLTKRFKRREGILTSQLLPMYGSDDFFLQFENPVQEDREFELKVLTQGFKLGTIDVDEWRVGMGMKAWGGEVGKSRGLPKPEPENKPGEEPEEELEESISLPAGQAPSGQKKNLGTDADIVLMKHNPNHGPDGRFTSGPSGGAVTGGDSGGVGGSGGAGGQPTEKPMSFSGHDPDGLQSYLDEKYSGLIDGTSKETKASLSAYVGDEGFVRINNALRGVGDITPETMKDVQNISKYIKDNPMKGDMTMYRGMSVDNISAFGKAGDTISLKNFGSHSAFKDDALEFVDQSLHNNKKNVGVLLVTTVKKGAPAAPAISGNKFNTREGEFIVDRGASYKVKKITKDKKTGYYKVHVEVGG